MFIQVSPKEFIAIETIAKVVVHKANYAKDEFDVEVVTKRGEKYHTTFQGSEYENLLQCGGVA